MSKAREKRAIALEEWAERVRSTDLTVADTEALRAVAELAEQRDGIDAGLTEAVRAARRSGRSWSEIGAMLGVSKQAAQRKYSAKLSA
ncbi:MAG: hypothetical protein U9N78_07820 [Actinomycetota bacterium]|nr:hypothetical protein [Actinomycetota bacterium]